MMTDITLTVYPQEDYHYEVLVGDEMLSVTYSERAHNSVRVSFGSIEEMRAVAKAMLAACDMKEHIK